MEDRARRQAPEMDTAAGQRPDAGHSVGVADDQQPIGAEHEVAAEAAGPGGLSGEHLGRWDYSFEVDTRDADPAMVLLMGVLDWPSITLTLSVAQSAAYKKGLEKHGIELVRLTRRRHPEMTR